MYKAADIVVRMTNNISGSFSAIHKLLTLSLHIILFKLLHRHRLRKIEALINMTADFR